MKPKTLWRNRRVGEVASLCGAAAILGVLRFAGAAEGDNRTELKPVFTAGPSVQMSARSAVIEFSVSAPTDVAVVVRDGKGRVVRHLGATVLGANAAEPFKKNCLDQAVEWDLLDDEGRPVPSDHYTVELGLGLGVELAKFYGWNPYEIGTVHGLGIGPNGEVYVMAAEGRDGMDGVFRIFSPKGKYLRTILPRPADLPLDRALPLGEVCLKTGERFPTVLLPSYGGRTLQTPVVTEEGDLVIVNSSPSGHVEGKRFRSKNFGEQLPRRLLRIAADGGAPKAGVMGPVLGSGFETAALHLAQGPDEMIYISGARHAVFRAKWDEHAKPEPFVGVPDKPGKGAEGLKNPGGIAFDAEGNLYVADRGNHRIAVFDRSGRFLSELPVEWPQSVLVVPRAGIIYVTSGYRRYELLKFESHTSATPSARYAIRSDMPVLTLDARGKRPVIYVGNVWREGDDARSRDRAIIRLTDAGREFREDGILGEYGRPRQPMVVGVDRERELVYGWWQFDGYWRLDGRTGRIEQFEIPLHPKANGISELSAGPDGTVLVHVTGEMGRLDHLLRPLPFSSSGSFIARVHEDCLRSIYAKDCCVSPSGDIYWIHERGGYSQPFRVSALNADGTIKKDSLIVLESASAGGIRVDRAGSIYLLDHLKPIGKPVPDDLADVVQVHPRETHVEHYGSILKFGPGGGRIRKVPKGFSPEPGQQIFMAGTGQAYFVADGVLWSYYGVSMLRSWHVGGGCKCWTPRFDVDDLGRVFVPDQLRSRILVLDSNGNLICTFGRYGNPDDKGAGVPLADPRTVMVSREAVYVGDMTNQRVVRCRLGYRQKRACAVKVPAQGRDQLVQDLSASEQIEKRRQLLRVRNAEARLEEARAEAQRVSPSLRRRLDWDGLVSSVARQSAGALANLDDARAVVGVRAPRDVPRWSEREAAALLAMYMSEGSEWVRLSTVWGLWGGALGNTGREVLMQALADPSERVRVAAAYCLLTRNDPAGLSHIFRGATSADPDTFKIAETAMLRNVARYDPSGAGAALIDERAPFVPCYPIGPREVEALVSLLNRGNWYLDRLSLILLGMSGQPAAARAIMERLDSFRDRNLNRALGALGVLRCREAVPAIIKYLARGRAANYGTDSYNGDEAEKFAATALARISDPASVGPVIQLLDSDKPNAASEALRCLTLMFDPATPPDRRLLPRDQRLESVRIDELPEAREIRSRWEAFWKANSSRYSRNESASGLVPR